MFNGNKQGHTLTGDRCGGGGIVSFFPTSKAADSARLAIARRSWKLAASV